MVNVGMAMLWRVGALLRLGSCKINEHFKNEQSIKHRSTAKICAFELSKTMIRARAKVAITSRKSGEHLLSLMCAPVA